MSEQLIVGSGSIRIHSVTGKYEPATALALDLITNYVEGVRCTDHNVSVAASDVFKFDTPCQKHMYVVRKVTSYFK